MKKVALLTGRTLSISIAFVCGCSVKAYPGPELPEEDISTLTIATDQEISLPKVSVDNNNIPTTIGKVELLPGKHSVKIDFRIDHREECAGKDYYCSTEIYRGRCHGQLTTVAGRPYLLTIHANSGIVEMTFSPKGYFDFFERDDEANFASGSCTLD